MVLIHVEIVKFEVKRNEVESDIFTARSLVSSNDTPPLIFDVVSLIGELRATPSLLFTVES